jgi:hypothetical protein
MNKMGRVCSTYGEKRGVYRVLVGETEGKMLLGRPNCRQDGNIKMDLQEMRWGAWTGFSWLKVGTNGRFL